MATPRGTVRTTCAAILAAIAAKLVADGVVSESSRVLYVARRASIPHFGADKDVLLTPLGFRLHTGQDVAGGRGTSMLLRTITVTCRTRLGTDESGRDRVWLTAEDIGQLAFEEAVVDCLHNYWPEDSSRNVITAQPLKLMEGNAPDKDAKDPTWGQSTLAFSAFYHLNLTQQDNF